MKQLLKFSLASIVLCAGTMGFAETYIVRKGDTIANIARTRYGEPVFGPKGSIKRIFKMNPGLKSTVPLEPGQKIVLEDKMSEYPAEKVPRAKPSQAPAPPPVAAEASVAVIPKDAAHLMSPAERAAHEMDLKPKGPMPEATPAPVEEAPKAVHAESHPSEPETTGEAERPHNYFSFIPSYSMITQSATENDTHATYSLHSSPAWGAELGWDHWWNDSFSTVLTYAVMQFTSKESSDVTNAKVLSKVNFNRTELALLNRLVRWMRFGVGATYGDHLFPESFSSVPINPQVYKLSYLSPFLTAEFTAYETAQFEFLVNVKATQLPAQVGFGHDVAAGTEYFGQVSMLQKFAKFKVLYGLSYSTENQSRIDATETRTEWALKIGALF